MPKKIELVIELVFWCSRSTPMKHVKELWASNSYYMFSSIDDAGKFPAAVFEESTKSIIVWNLFGCY